jgi:hypothetical protein
MPVSSGALVAAAFGLDGCVPAPDALTVGQVSELAGDLLAVWLVLPADLPDGNADTFADMRAPCPELLIGGGCRWRLGVEDVLRILLEQRIDGRAGAEVAGFGRSWPGDKDVNLV